MYAGSPITPVHSPHHSVTSSAASRTPIHTLTIHEYRKQQHTPIPRADTPSGKTLRRKPAAATLSEREGAPPASHSLRSGSGSSLRPLHFSQSVYQLKSDQSPFPPQTNPGLSFRSQSAEPYGKGDSISSISTANSSGKVRHFNSRKRLPRPPATTGSLHIPPPPFVNVKAPQLWRPQLPAALRFSNDDLHSSDAQTTPTPSTFSLSRFPQPPNRGDPPFSPPLDGRDTARVNTLRFSTTAPATPPATPAIIHYRGTSFDLVNPHDSLLLHDIVTPSKDFESSDNLLLRSEQSFDDFSDVSFCQILYNSRLTTTKMAPKRPLYGDLGSAHAGIMRRADDSFNGLNPDLPVPPMPAAISPNSSSYTSPMYSPESINAPSPLAVRKQVDDSRFSLKQLTRSLTKKLGKSPARNNEEELQDMRNSSMSIALVSIDGQYLRPLTETYVTTPQATYFPVNPMSPNTPTSPVSIHDYSASSLEGGEVELPRRHTSDRYSEKPLASLIPGDPSTQLGRMQDSHLSAEDGDPFSKPYYDDLDSIYRSSSVYTGDGHQRSNYQQSLARLSQSNPFVRYSGVHAVDLASEYNLDSLYNYGGTQRQSSQPSTQETHGLYHHSINHGDAKTDTISKLIDEYSPEDNSNQPFPIITQQPADTSKLITTQSRTYAGYARGSVGLNQFDFDLRNHRYEDNQDLVSPIQPVLHRRPTIIRDAGMPPYQAPPLAPAFEYDEAPFMPPRLYQSAIFSNGSYNSYGDTRNLLQMCQSEAEVPFGLAKALEPSSSYSQPEVKILESSSSYSQQAPISPQTPREALSQAEKIFQDVVTEHQLNEDAIPAMWARRSSGSLLLSKKITNQSNKHLRDVDSFTEVHDRPISGEKADWETIGDKSRGARDSLDSIADYSSSEGTRNSLGLTSNGSLPSWVKQNTSAGPSLYSHPSLVRAHLHPFSSSPPVLDSRSNLRTAPEMSPSSLKSSPLFPRTAPALQLSPLPEGTLYQPTVEEPFAFKPWANPYAFSDKETLELLASGPNDNIMVDDGPSALDRPAHIDGQYRGREVVSSSSDNVIQSPGELERENSFEKYCVVGPKGNLTGTPRGTGMNGTGSSVADTSSPGLKFGSSAGRQSFCSDYKGFYVSPFPAVGSVTRISESRPMPATDQERTPSQITLFPNGEASESAEEISPSSGTNQRRSLHCSTTFQPSRRTSRSAVPGQTKLRQMLLAGDARTTMSSQDTHFSRFIDGGERPSTSHTNTPLRPTHNISVDTFPLTPRTVIAHQHSPHLLCPEREANAEDEARRRKLSWFILAAFCILPPCIILFRIWGDSIIISVTEGRLGHVTPKSKKMALVAGIVINIGLVTAILVPVLVAHALKAV